MAPAKKPTKAAVRKKTANKFRRRSECDAMFGKIVRASGVCVHCGGTEVIQCAHGFSRSYHAIRWDFRNAFPLCRADHMHFTHRPLEWDEWLHATWGDDLYDELRALALTHLWPDMDELHADLKARVEELIA